MIEWIIVGGAITVIVVLICFMVIDTVQHTARGCVEKWVGNHVTLVLIGKVLMPMTVDDYVWVCPVGR